MPEHDPPERIELIEEQLKVSKRQVERGRVVIHKRVSEREEIAEVELRHDEIVTRRVPRGVPVETAPAVREEDGVLIIPVIEERLVLRTELFLVEELHVVTTSRTELVREPVRLRSERLEVTRLEGRGTDQVNHETE